MLPTWRRTGTEGVTRFWWVRHGPVRVDPGTIKGHMDVPCDLPPALVATARDLLPPEFVVVASPLRRAVDTARAVTGRAPDATDPALMEQDFGAWSGRTWADLEAEAEAMRFWDHPATARPPGGESFADQVGRVSGAIGRLCAAHGGGDVVAVCHAGTIRAALAHALALGDNPAAALGFAIAPLSVTRIDVFPGGAARVLNVGLGGDAP